MYARVTTFHLKMEKAQEAVDIYENSVIPEAEKQNGFRSACFLLNKNAGKFVSITMWATMQDAVNNAKSGYFQRQVDKFEKLMVDSPDIEGFEVGAHKHNFDQ